LVRNGKYTESNITTDKRHRASSHHPRQGTEQYTQNSSRKTEEMDGQ